MSGLISCLRCTGDKQTQFLVRQDDLGIGSVRYLCLYHHKTKCSDPVWEEIFALCDELIAQAQLREKLEQLCNSRKSGDNAK